MFTREARLTRDDFKKLTKGAVSHTPHFSVRTQHAPEIPYSRFGVVISKKVAANATDRKRLARRIKHILRSLNVSSETMLVVVYVQKGASTLSFGALKSEIEALLEKTSVAGVKK